MGISVVPDSGKMGVRTALIAIALSGTLPAGQNQWTAVGPEGGSVLQLAAEPGNLSTVYAATCAGVFKTADRGVSWSAVNSGLPVTSGCSGILAVDPQNSGTVYAVRDKEIFKTADGGASWSAISGLDATNSLQALVIDPSNPNTLYTGATEVFKSTDGGVTWGPAVIPIHSCCLHMLAVDPHNSNTIYAAYGAGFGGAMSKSTDGGASWSPADSGLPWTDVFVIDPRNSDTLYASAGGRIFKSTDGGANWISLSFRLPAASEPMVRDSALCLAVNPQNPALIYAV